MPARPWAVCRRAARRRGGGPPGARGAHGSAAVAESRTRKATAWLTEKVTELKLRLDDPAGGALRLLEALEAVSLGIEGKRALWRALAAAAEDAP